MKKLSDHAAELVRELREKTSIFDRLTSRRVQILEKLEALEEPASIPFLAGHLFSGGQQERVVCARSMSHLLQMTDANDLPVLDEMLRRGCWFESQYRKLQPSELANLVGPAMPGTIFLQIASMHPNGFVREEAVRRLGQISDGSELPYLLMLLNDWVPVVRQASLAAVERRLDSAYVDAIIANLPLVLALERRQRAREAAIFDKIFELLQAPSARARLVLNLKSPDKEIRRRCWNLLESAPDADKEELFHLAASNADPILRVRAVKSLADASDTASARSNLLQATRDAFYQVRKEALLVLSTRFPIEMKQCAEIALLDSSSTIRAFSRFLLREVAPSEFAKTYRNAILRNDRRLPEAICGLAETGIASDTDVVYSHLSNPKPAVRRAAIYALMKLAPDKYEGEVLRYIADPSPSVSKQATRSIRSAGQDAGGDDLFGLANSRPGIHVWRNAVSLISTLPKWEALIFLLRAARNPDARKASIAEDQLIGWNLGFNRRHVAPTSAELESINLELDIDERSTEKPSRKWLETLRFALQQVNT